MINTHEISNETRQSIPYQGGEQINFTHSNGYAFITETSTEQYFNSSQEHCEDYYLYESIIVKLTSNLPSINIAIEIYAHDTEEYYNDLPSIRVNNYYFTKDSETTDLTINGITYTNVFQYTPKNDASNITTLFYNFENGVLKINYNDGSYVQINA